MFSFLQNNKIAYFILIFAGIVVYANSLPNAMLWDDYDFILNNQFVKNFDLKHIFTENIIAGAGFLSNYFRPVLSIIFAIEWRLFGEWAPGYHIVSIIFHIASGLLLFSILQKLFNAFAIPFFVSLIFLIHPLQTEVVAYANGLGDSLSVFLMFLSIIFYPIGEVLDNIKLRNYFLALLFYVLALFSKETAIILPVLILIMEFLLWRQNTTQQHTNILENVGMFSNYLKRMIFFILPFLIIAGIYIYLRATVLNFENTFNFYDEPNAYTESVWIRILTFLRVLTIYFGLLILPIKLHYERTIDENVSILAPDILLALFISLILLTIALLNLWRLNLHNNCSKSDFEQLSCPQLNLHSLEKSKKPEYLFALGWFFVGLAPSSGIVVPINNFLFEHWLYLPQIGFFLFLGFLTYEITKKYENTKNKFFIFRNFLEFRTFVSIIIIVFLIFLSIQTIKRNAEWRSPIKFYEQILQFSPRSGRVWNNLGTEYAKIGKLEEAKNAYLKSIELIPKNPGPYNNVGNIFAASGELDTAAEYWQKSSDLNPDFLPPRKALEQYNQIKKSAPENTKIKMLFK